jgi:hypothetical protein
VSKKQKLPALTTAAATATTAAASTTAATAAAPTAASKPAAPTTSRFRTSFVHIDRASVHLGAVQLRNRRFRIALFGHFNESETARLPGIAIGDDIDPLHVAILREGGVQVLLGGLIAKVPDKNIGHQNCSLIDLDTGWVRKRWLPAPRAGDGSCKTMHIGRNGWDSDSYPWIGRSISMKINTADRETSFYIRLKARVQA